MILIMFIKSHFIKLKTQLLIINYYQSTLELLMLTLYYMNVK